MFAFLMRGDKGRPAPERRSARLGLEGLETRQLLSGVGSIVPAPALNAPVQMASSVNALNSQASHLVENYNNEIRAISGLFQNYLGSIQHSLDSWRVLQYELTHSVPSFAGITFNLKDSKGDYHTLKIVSQTDNFLDTASFTGVWGDAAGNKSADVTGTISGRPDGSFGITFTWNGPNASKGLHTFGAKDGQITGEPGSYYLSGTVVVQGGGGPGLCSGYEQGAFVHLISTHPFVPFSL
jgi:hypothetical protein